MSVQSAEIFGHRFILAAEGDADGTARRRFVISQFDQYAMGSNQITQKQNGTVVLAQFLTCTPNGQKQMCKFSKKAGCRPPGDRNRARVRECRNQTLGAGAAAPGSVWRTDTPNGQKPRTVDFFILSE